MLSGLFKDSFAYGVANAIQKLVPFFILPVITSQLGQQALKVYDVSIIYAYLFSFLVIMGQDAAASVLYFDNKRNKFSKTTVTSHAFFIQLLLMLLVLSLVLTFSSFFSSRLFGDDEDIARRWSLALLILPGHVLLNFTLNILLWQKRKVAYIFLCALQTVLSLGAVLVSVLLYDAGIEAVFYALIGSSAAAGITGIILVRKQVLDFSGTDVQLVKKLLVLGFPFALTSLFHQLLPSLDRYFLLHMGYGQSMAPYILAAKLGALVSFPVSAFVLAFTPYSMAKLNDDDAEENISGIFRQLVGIAFMSVPLLLIFRNVLVEIFADASYGASVFLLPFFFFGWIFDLFSYFSMVGIYKSQKSYLMLVFFGMGVLVTWLLNILLIPLWGFTGAAAAFLAAKMALFYIPWFWLRKEFFLKMDHLMFWVSFTAAALCSYLLYVTPASIAIPVVLLACGAAVYFSKELYFSFRKFLRTKTNPGTATKTAGELVAKNDL